MRAGPVSVAVLFLFLRGFSPAAALTIVKDGTPESIIVSGQSTQVERFAVNELRDYIQKITGARLEDRKSLPEERNRIIVGNVHGMPGTETYFDDAASDEAFVVKILDKNTLLLLGNCPRSTLYAVYDFLEELGCRFFAPDLAFYEGDHEHVPNKASIQVKSLDVFEEPVFEYRTTHFSPPDWSTKMRLYPSRGADSPKRGLVSTHSGHNQEQFIPSDKYFDDHPEWFAYIPDKSDRSIVRRPERYNWQGNYSSSKISMVAGDAVETYVENYIEFVRETPGGWYYDVQLKDGLGWDHREEALKRFNNPAEQLAYLTSVFAERLYEVDPSARAILPAYAQVQVPPERKIPFKYDNVRIAYYTFGRRWHAPIYEKKEHLRWRKDRPRYHFIDHLKRWQKVYPEVPLYVVNYYNKGAFRSLPVQFQRLIPREYRYYRKIGVDGVQFHYLRPYDNWLVTELNAYIHAKLAWDPDRDVEALIRDYCRKRYPGAGKIMRQYHASMREIMMRFGRHGSWSYRGKHEDLYQSLEDMKKPKALIDRAISEVRTPTARKRLELLQTSCRYAELEIKAYVQADRARKYDNGTIELDSRARKKLVNRALATKNEMLSFLDDPGEVQGVISTTPAQKRRFQRDIQNRFQRLTDRLGFESGNIEDPLDPGMEE